MLRTCPACDEPFDDDGDRIIDDECFHCGWARPDRKANNRLNDAIFEFERAVVGLAKDIYETQRAVDVSLAMPAGGPWQDLSPEEQSPYILKARLVLHSHEQFWRGKLIAIREGKRTQLAQSPLYEPGEIADEQVEDEAMELYKTENRVRIASGDQSDFLPWHDVTISVRESYRSRAARAIRARRGAPAARGAAAGGEE